jgi:perosamine synthetase
MAKTTHNIAFSKPCFGLEEQAAAAAAIASGWVVGGPRLAEFEAAIAKLCQTEQAIGVSSWTAGAFLVLKALGIGPGDEVIVPSLTFIASVNVIVHAGATPVFADIDPSTFNIDPDDIEHRITPRTKAILPVDQIGLPCEIDRILSISEAHGLTVIQDAACSLGSRFRDRPVGAWAPITIFSLHARKVVTTGEGGMIVTNEKALADRLRRLRHQGMSLTDYQRHDASPTTFETYPEIGYNFRMTDIQAAIGLVQLSKLEAMLARRRTIAEYYIHHLANHPLLQMPHVPAHATPNWQSFQLRLRDDFPMSRNALMTDLHLRGITTRRGVMASHQELPYRGLGKGLQNTEAIAASGMQLPIFPDLSDEEVDFITREVDLLTRRHEETQQYLNAGK